MGLRRFCSGGAFGRCGRAPALRPGGGEGAGPRLRRARLKMAPGDVGADGAGIQAVSPAQPLLGAWGL